MNEKQEQTDWSTWYSTYGVLTAERILERYNIALSHDELIKSVKDHGSMYYQLLRAPMKNVYNGIILQQAHDYQVYAQKLFIDYLMSGEDAKENETLGAETRASLEEQRLRLIELGDAFFKLEGEHEILIAESQGTLIELSQDIHGLRQAVAGNPRAIEQAVAIYLERAAEINVSLRRYRSDFYALILKVTELLRLLGDFKPDQDQVAENKEALEFDALIGED